MNTYTKLKDGSWGIRGTNLVPGTSITVTKKSGETKQETVGNILWTGDGVSLATIATPAASSLRPATSRKYSDRKTCCNCGDPLDAYAIRKGYRRCLECVDGGSKAHGGMSYRDRNGNFVLGDDD